jgi:hypothetical protein
MKPAAELDHRENIIAFGHGFDWFKRVNRMLIVNDDDPAKGSNLAVAAKIVLANRDAARISGSGALVLISVPYYTVHEREASILRVKYLIEIAKSSIEQVHASKASFFRYLPCVMRWESRQLEVIDFL